MIIYKMNGRIKNTAVTFYWKGNTLAYFTNLEIGRAHV